MVDKFENIDDIIKNCPHNTTIGNNLIRAFSIINRDNYKKILCSISGGSDSDIVLDICFRCDLNNKIDYVWFDTGLEYKATKDHILELEKKYNIKIKQYKAKKPIPIVCKEYGQPFISKNVSEHIHRLQQHNFTFVDDDFDELYKKYPNCKSSLQWWCNKNKSNSLNIKNNKFLKEFLIENPPNFKISNKCCEYAKKKIAHEIIKKNNYDLNIVGIRKAEGGIRSSRFKNCFDDNGIDCDNYRPIFWYTNEDKLEYEQYFDINHSDCYKKYKLKRTGCCGCPYGKNFEYELEVLKKYEPLLFNAVNNIFNDTYLFTKQYKNFIENTQKYNN